MKKDVHATDEALLRLMGERLKRYRLAKNLTQQQVAEQAGLGLRTVQRMEKGEAATHLSGFVRVCRVLGLVDRLDALIPELAVSPIAQLKLQGRMRKRASGQKARSGTPAKWTWGEEP